MFSTQLFEAIKHLGIHKKYQKEECLFFAGDKASGFYYILIGEVRIYKMDENARQIELRRFGPENFIGEIILFASENFPVFAETTKNTTVVFFPKERILNAIDNKPEVARLFLTLYAKRCLALNDFIETTKFKNVRQKLLEYVVSLCNCDGNCVVDLPLKKVEIARHIGTISETLSRNFNKLEEEGLIRIEGKKIHILQCDVIKREIS